MNKLYEQQLNLNRLKINEDSGKMWKRKHMSDVSLPKSQPSSKKKEDLPVEPESELSDYTGADLAWDVAGTVDPTGAVDLANAVRYAAKGKWADAGISALGAIPYVGDLAKASRVTKAATKAITKADAPIEVVARRIPRKAQSVTEVKPRKAPDFDIPSSKPSSSLKMFPSTTTASPSNIVKKSPGALAKTARDIATGAAATEIVRAAKRVYDKSGSDDEDDDSGDKSKMTYDPRPETQLNLQRLSIFDPGEASGYSKSVVSKRGHEDLPPGYHPFFTGPVGVELHRRRSSYAHSKGLPESVENENVIKNRIKSSVANYLKSKDGKKLNDHLESVRKAIDLR